MRHTRPRTSTNASSSICQDATRLFGLLPFALLLLPPIARNLLSASQVRLLAKPIPQACAGCAALTPAPRSRPLAVSAKAGLQPGVARARSFRRDLSSCCSPLTHIAGLTFQGTGAKVVRVAAVRQLTCICSNIARNAFTGVCFNRTAIFLRRPAKKMPKRMRQILIKREEERPRQDAELKAEIRELKAEILIKGAALASAMQQVRGPGSRYRLLLL